uniref:Uncharacterized protein n=1 Tax=Oryza punctata TaxID=4537 RepID=A0A0E0LZD4_ORYPU
MPSAASARSRRAALLARRRHPSRTRCDLSDTSGLVRSSGLSGQVICPPLANFLSGPAYLFLLLKLVLVHLLLLVRNLWLIGEKGSYQIYTDVLRCYEGDSVEGAIPKRWIPKYRITVYASDVSRLEPDAPPVELLFFGEVGQSLVGKPTILLVSNARGQQTYVPPELISLTGGKYDLIVEMSFASLQSESPSFRVRAIVGNDNGPLHHSPPGDIGQSASGSFQELGSTGLLLFMANIRQLKGCFLLLKTRIKQGFFYPSTCAILASLILHTIILCFVSRKI